MNIDAAIKSLSERRKLFHSEADFQHELAWELKTQNEYLDIRLERPLGKTGIKYIDLFAHDKQNIGIELKYKTKRLEFTIMNENFRLASHAATNLARYDFLKDVQRLEELKKEGLIDIGYAVFLSNVSAYWNGNKNESTLSQDFYISENEEISGTLSWVPGIKVSSVGKDRLSDLNITGNYNSHWENYSEVNNDIFRYLIFEI